jgi:hypothetical protein
MFGVSYLKLAGLALAAAAVIGLGIYVMSLRSDRDEALVKAATLQATNNELTAVHDNDVKALAELEQAKAASEAALIADAKQQQRIVKTVTEWKEKVKYVPVPKSACRVADARDIAVLDGVRSILAGTASADPDANHQDPSPGGIAGGHPSASGARPAPTKP